MSVALGYIYDIFDEFLTLVFNDLQLFSGVSIGWILTSLIIIYFVISNILVIPFGRSSGRSKGEKENG